MACRKWEETGLLYAAGELGEQEALDYETHLAGCVECRDELERYRRERVRFFTTDVLGEVTSSEVDAEILRVCSDPRSRARISAPALFAAFFRRQIFIPAMLFVVGFISVGYIVMNMENARQMSAGATAAVRSQQGASQIQTAEAAADSLEDSLKGFADRRGNLSDKGVVTVDLKK
jgi:anti-sigma factor RsiW